MISKLLGAGAKLLSRTRKTAKQLAAARRNLQKARKVKPPKGYYRMEDYHKARGPFEPKNIIGRTAIFTSGSGFKKRVTGAAANKARRHFQLGFKYGGGVAILGLTAGTYGYALLRGKKKKPVDLSKLGGLPKIE